MRFWVGLIDFGLATEISKFWTVRISSKMRDAVCSVAGDAPLIFVVNNFPDFWTTIKFGRFPISHLFFGVTHMTCELQVSFRSPFSKAILPSTDRSEILSPTRQHTQNKDCFSVLWSLEWRPLICHRHLRADRIYFYFSRSTRIKSGNFSE